MEKLGRTLLAWPEDQILQGQELETLQETLSPFALKLAEIVEQESQQANLGPFAYKRDEPGKSSYGGQATVDIAGEAIKGALNFLQRPLSSPNLQAIVQGCWDRNAEFSEHVQRAQRFCVWAALGTLQNKGEIVEGPSSFFTLVGTEQPGT